MNKVLDNLSDEEIHLAIRVKRFTGSMQDREKSILNSDITEVYQNIYKKYYLLYKEIVNIETLKRIIFIQWYAVAEPLAFTGIGALDNQIAKDSFEIVSKLINQNAIDNEFEGMILHYYAISDYYFNLYFDFLPFIQMITSRHKKNSLELPFVNRGIMGEYWNRTGINFI